MSSAAPPPALSPLVLRLASGIRYCYCSASPRRSPAPSNPLFLTRDISSRHLCRKPLRRCSAHSAQCKPVLTGTTHGDSVANAELFSFFYLRNRTQEMFFLLCAARGHRSEVCVCAFGCRLRFSTRSVVGQSLHNSPSRFWLGLFSILLLQDGQFSETMNAKKPDTVCHNTFSPVGGSAALCRQDRGANHSSYQGTSEEQLQVWMVMASSSFFTCKYCTLMAAFSF